MIDCKKFKSHSGIELDFKIECDDLTKSDIACIAKLISDRSDFFHVIGIPTGGLRLAKALRQYCDKSSKILLIVDDVLTTGKSMNEYKSKFKNTPTVGWVIFARYDVPLWVNSVFSCNMH